MQHSEPNRYLTASRLGPPLLIGAVVASAWLLATQGQDTPYGAYHSTRTTSVDLFAADEVQFSPLVHSRLASRNTPVTVDLAGCGHLPSAERISAQQIHLLARNALLVHKLHQENVVFGGESTFGCKKLNISVPKQLDVSLEMPLNFMAERVAAVAIAGEASGNIPGVIHIPYTRTNPEINIYRPDRPNQQGFWQLNQVPFVPES